MNEYIPLSILIVMGVVGWLLYLYSRWKRRANKVIVESIYPQHAIRHLEEGKPVQVVGQDKVLTLIWKNREYLAIQEDETFTFDTPKSAIYFVQVRLKPVKSYRLL